MAAKPLPQQQQQLRKDHDLSDEDAEQTRALKTKYEQLEKLGEGTYGVVFKARDTTTNEIVAIKNIRLESIEEGTPSTAIREISILKHLHHSNIVHLIEVFHSRTNLALVFEFLDQDLHNYINVCSSEGIDDYTTRSFLFQLLQALIFCHENNILHRDLKPQNLLINLNGELKLGDFGLARCHGLPVRKYAHEVVTMWYRPPDLHLGSDNYSTSIDMWGAGCIFAEMSNGRPFFRGSDNLQHMDSIFSALGMPNRKEPGSQQWPQLESYPLYQQFKAKGIFNRNHTNRLKSLMKNLDADGLDLLSRMLVYDPTKRITAAEAVKHPYFNMLFAQQPGSN